MLNKKLMILAIFFVSLLAVSAVSAADGDDIVGDDAIGVDDEVSNVDDNVLNDPDILGNDGSQDEVSLDGDEVDAPLEATFSSGDDDVIGNDDGEIYASHSPDKLSVKSKTYISAEDVATSYGYGKVVAVTLKDDYGGLSGKTVTVNINGKIYTSVTNSAGQIFFNIPKNIVPKTYTALFSFAGDDTYEGSSKSVNVVVSKLTTKIKVKSVKGTSGKKVKLTATVTDNFGNRVKKCTVIFKVKGKKYTAKTNSKGIATVKVKVPKSSIVKISTKIKKKILTKTTFYKKTYTCTASVKADDKYRASSSKFKVTSKKKKIQKYRIVKKQTKTITIPYKQYGFKQKKSGHYIFGIVHEQREINRISVLAGDKTLQKYIKFSSKAYYINHGNKVYIYKNRWLKSKHYDDIHYYYYEGEAKIYVTIKYNAYTFKKI